MGIYINYYALVIIDWDFSYKAGAGTDGGTDENGMACRTGVELSWSNFCLEIKCLFRFY